MKNPIKWLWEKWIWAPFEGGVAIDLDDPYEWKLDVAKLVSHKNRPGSFGYVKTMEPLTVVWCIGGEQAYNEHQYSEPEECKPYHLKLTTCPGCGEDMCWCGVGR